MIGSGLHPSAAPNHVIHLVFAMRLLGIDTALRQNVNTGAHGRHAKKFQIEFASGGALAVKIVNVEEVRRERLEETVWQRGYTLFPRRTRELETELTPLRRGKKYPCTAEPVRRPSAALPACTTDRSS